MAAKTKKTMAEFREMTKVISDLTKTIDKIPAALDKIQTGKVEGLTDSLEASSEEADKLFDRMEDLSDTTDDLNRSFKKLDIERKLKPKAIAGIQKRIADINAKTKKTQENFKKLGKNVPKEKIQEFREEMRGIRNEQRDISNAMNEINDDVGDGVSSARKFGGALGAGFSPVRALILGTHKDLIASADSAKNFGNGMAAAGKKIMAAKGGASLLGSSMKMMGGVVGGIGKVLGSWPVILGKMAADFMVAADTFIKDANKAFAMIRGPDIMTKKVKGQFKDFNDQIYSIGDNIRVGLNVQQIREFMSATVGAGLNITRLNEGLTNYRDAIYIAAKASKTLGMDLPQVGAVMGQLITDFRMNILDVDKAFVQVAFDAKKSGLSTDRFWTAVQNASASLSFYGVFIKQASSMMANFTKTGVMGASETASTVEEVTQSFNKMSLSQRAAVMDLVRTVPGGSKAFTEMFSDIEKEWKNKASDLQGRINMNVSALGAAKGEEADKIRDEIAKDRSELGGIMSKVQMATEAQHKDAVGMAPYLPLLAAKAPELLTRLMSIMGNIENQSGEQIWVSEKIFEKMGLSSELVMKLKGLAKANLDTIERQLGIAEGQEDTQNTFLGEMQKGTKISEDMKSVIGTKFNDLLKTSDPDEMIVAQQSMAQYLRDSLGWDEDSAKNFARVASLDKDTADIMRKQLVSGKALGEEQIRQLKAQMRKSGIAGKAVAKANVEAEKTRSQTSMMAKNTFSSLVDQTLSFEDVKGITEDGVKYQAYSLMALLGIDKGVMGIYKHLLGGSPTEEQKKATKKLQEMGVLLKGQKPTQENISKGIKETVTKMAALSQASTEAAGIQDEFAKISQKAAGSKGGMLDLTPLRARLDLLKGKEDTPEYKILSKTLSKAQGINDKILKSGKKGDTEQRKLLSEELRQEGLAIAAEKTQAEKDLDSQQKNLKNLQALGENTDQMVRLQTALLMGDDKTMASMGTQFGEMLDNSSNQADTLDQIASEYGLTPSDIAMMLSKANVPLTKEFKDWGKKASEQSAMAPNTYKYQNQGRPERAVAAFERTLDKLEPGSSWKPPEKPDNYVENPKDGLRQPMKITQSEYPALLHRGEWIMPRASQWTMPTTPTLPKTVAENKVAPTAVSAPQTFNINVSATEKDLASRIANEVRGVLYRRQTSAVNV